MSDPNYIFAATTTTTSTEQKMTMSLMGVTEPTTCMETAEMTFSWGDTRVTIFGVGRAMIC